MKKIIYLLIPILFIVALVVPTIYWYMNPELTKMQVFQEWWWLYVPVVIIGILTQYRTKK
jgi:hypothetical protein